MKFHENRREYESDGLAEADLSPDPIAQFGRWFGEAMDSGATDVEAASLATTGLDGSPRARIVLLKAFDARGFVFFTNYLSDKSRELDADPRSALCFFWRNLDRQVRVQGRAARVENELNDAYFATRPRGSQIGAWASPQSAVVEGREDLEARMSETEKRFGAEGLIPRPAHWGGWRIEPELIEFWQGRASRLHDRLRFRKERSAWIVERVAP